MRWGKPIQPCKHCGMTWEACKKVKHFFVHACCWRCKHWQPK